MHTVLNSISCSVKYMSNLNDASGYFHVQKITPQVRANRLEDEAFVEVGLPSCLSHTLIAALVEG